MSQPRAEYPRPQFVRPEWVNLNGEWQFEVDRSRHRAGARAARARAGAADHRPVRAGDASCPGSSNIDFLEAVWYRHDRHDPGRLGRHGAVSCTSRRVDHDATVWVNGVEVVRHRGGFTPFSADLSHVRRAGRGGHDRGPRPRQPRSGPQARGKQAHAVRQPRLPLHPDHRHLADRLAGGRAGRAPAPPADHPGRGRLGSFHLEVPAVANRPAGTSAPTLQDADGEVTRGRGCAADPDLAPRLRCRSRPTAAACGRPTTRSCTT